MKNPHLIPIAALILLAASGCDRQSPEVAKKLAELEQKNQQATDRQRELEQELEDQKLAAERDAIERERARIEEDREELERQQGEAAAAQDAAIREREEALANREGKLEEFQAALEEKDDDLQERTQQLSESERELAGREALPFEDTVQGEPVADYDMFYDSLSPYGSWFETADYGYVWQPVVVRESNWRPYSRGRWACSDRGWTWISDEPFGWATYHYGRWTLLRGHGWIWVPGTEWAPCWVSWRENDSHIGWAPLPPETLAYRGHNWDSSVDVQFGIGALCYNFVETRYFGSSIYNHCLPVSGNGSFFLSTTNITFIHIKNRQVICGGPKYKQVCDRIGRPVPFYRLEMDRKPRTNRDMPGMRPRVTSDRLVFSAPNMDVAWNDGLRPKRIKGRIETVTVERNGNLSREVTDRYRQSREEGRQKAETAVAEAGGVEKFEQLRDERLQDKRRQADGKGRREETREIAKIPDRPQRDIPGVREPGRIARPADPDTRVERMPDEVARQSNEDRPLAETRDDRRNPVVRDTSRVTPPEAVQPRQETRQQRPADDRRVARPNEASRQVETRREQQRQPDAPAPTQKEAVDRRRDEQARERQRQEQQNEAAQARREQQEANQRRQDEQERQREAQQAREAQQEAIRQQQREQQERAQRQQQEQAQQREQERARRQQQQEDQQREMQRQEERAQQREQQERAQRQQQEENQRQRQQEENQRQQENARQRQQQEDNQRQRQQEESRQRQERDQKDQDEQRRRNR